MTIEATHPRHHEGRGFDRCEGLIESIIACCMLRDAFPSASALASPRDFSSNCE